MSISTALDRAAIAGCYLPGGEAARNKFNTGSSVADLLLTKSVKLLGADNDGELDFPTPSAFTASARNWGSGKIRLDWQGAPNFSTYSIECDEVEIVADLENETSYEYEPGDTDEHDYVVIAHNATGDTEADPVSIAAILGDSEATAWTAFKNVINSNAALLAFVTTFTYNRIENTLPGAGEKVFIAYPYVSDPNQDPLELTVRIQARVGGNADALENTMMDYVKLIREAIATFPDLEPLFTASISDDLDAGGIVMDDMNDENVAEAELEVKIKYVA